MFARERPRPTKRSARLFGALGLALLLVGCATPTPYGPAENGKGYSERQTERDRYRVSFAGNAQTSRETVESYLLYRAAEITLESGNNHFRIVEQDLETKTRYFETVSASPAFGSFGYSRFYGHRGTRVGGFATVQSRPITSYEAVANIIVFSAKESAEGERLHGDHAYNARDVIRQLEATILRPEEKSG